MICTIRTKILCFVCIFYLLASTASIASPESEREEMRTWAARILSQFLFLRDQGVMTGPFFLAIDGAPASGKSYISKPLMEMIQGLVQELGLNITTDVFPQDAFLHARADRMAKYGQLPPGGLGDGFFGNADGAEFRWDALMDAVGKFIKREPYIGLRYVSEGGGLLHGPTEFKTSNADIVIFEGTHSLGYKLAPYMHFGIFLGVDPALASWNRTRRLLAKGRSREVINASVDVAERHSRIHIAPNVRNAQLVFHNSAEGVPPYADFTPERDTQVVITRRLVIDPDLPEPDLSKELQTELHNLEKSGIVGEESTPLRHVVSGTTVAFWQRLRAIFTGHHLTLHIPASDNHCFFSALSRFSSSIRATSRQDVLKMLRNLVEALRSGSVTMESIGLEGTPLSFIEQEIEIINGNGWGGITTLQYLWAALIFNGHTPTKSLIVVFRAATEVKILRFNTNGTIESLDDIPDGEDSIIVNEGGTHWMWAAPAQISIPHSDSGFLEDLGATGLEEGLQNLHLLGEPDPALEFGGGIMF